MIAEQFSCSQAWEAKDFLVEQKGCAEFVIESKSYYGKYSNKVYTKVTHAIVVQTSVENPY